MILQKKHIMIVSRELSKFGSCQKKSTSVYSLLLTSRPVISRSNKVASISVLRIFKTERGRWKHKQSNQSSTHVAIAGIKPPYLHPPKTLWNNKIKKEVFFTFGANDPRLVLITESWDGSVGKWHFVVENFLHQAMLLLSLYLFF